MRNDFGGNMYLNQFPTTELNETTPVSIEIAEQDSPARYSNKKQHILFVNRSYWPDMEATGQLLTELCQSLAGEEFYEVSVLCGEPNFAAEGVKYKSQGNEIINGVTVRRTWHTTFDKSKFFGRSINFVSFCVSAFFSLLFGKRPDVIVCQTDPPLSPIAACLVAFVRQTKFVCYLQDIYPDIAVECGKLNEGLAVKVLRKLLVWCYCRADRIVVVSNDMRDWLIAHCVDGNKVEVIHNWVDTEAIYPIKENNSFRREHRLDGKFVVMYSGNIGQTQRFEVLLDAAESLREQENVLFLFVGQGVKVASLKQEVTERGLNNISFLGYQPKEKLAESLSAADVQVVLLDKRMTQLMMPSKLYSALSSGTPIMGIGRRESHLAEIVVQNNSGWFFEEFQVDQITDQILKLARNPEQVATAGKNGRQLAVDEFNRTNAIMKFSNLAAKVTGLSAGSKKKSPLTVQSPQHVTSESQQLLDSSSIY